MAIAIDTNSGSGAWNNAESSVTWAHTCNGSNRTLVVYVNSYADKSTAVTYNGVSATFVAKQNYSIGQRMVNCYVLIAPASGANNIVATLSGNDYVRTAAVSLTDTKQTGQPQVYNNARVASGSSTASLSLTTTNTCWLVIGLDFNGTPTAGTNTQLIIDKGDVCIFAGTTAMSAGSNSLNFTSVPTSYDKPTVIVAIEANPSTDVTVSATVVSATFSAPASTVSGSANVAPAVQAATFSTPASVASGGATIASSVLTAVFSLPTVNVITPDAQILATVLTATFSLPTATPSGGASVDASVQSATFSIPAVSFIGSVLITPDAQVATFTTLAPTISAIGNVTVSATAVAATFSLQSPTVTAEQNAMFNAGVLSATFSVQAPTITAIRNVTIDASVISATFSIPTPLRKVGGLWTPQPRAQGVWTPQPRII